MALEFRQQLKLSQQLVMTPQLQMAIKLLQLSRLELVETIRQELETNPLLEESFDSHPDDSPVERSENPIQQELPADKEIKIEEKINYDVDWSNYIDEYNTPGKTHFETERKETPSYETFISAKESLNDHLLWQLLMACTTKEDEEIGSLIIGNLNSDGYLDNSIEEIFINSNYSIDRIESVLTLLQTFDPPGVCARDLKESLLIQARQLNLDNTLVTEIIEHHLNYLQNRNYKAISKELKADPNEILVAINIIKGLEPRPGRKFSDEEPQYITPDIYVHKLENDFVIVLNDDGMPKLKINSYYKNTISSGGKINKDAKEYINDKIRSAAWLIKSIQQRQKTIYRVMESILKFQREFFEKGITYMKPMVLRDIAQDIEMHESTISRVTTNKYAFTPQGIYELKYFFNSSINRSNGETIASSGVQEMIKKIIESEDPKKPYSDDKLTEILVKNNVNIARRTVAKYREMLRILSSNKRKQP
ncbi:RNA polymerase factor sigma-54 [Desulfobacterium sp. N47]|uniref:RNA polymerase sigma-54 factor n=1 Tax=uncultured Desulfobacterium sp. TaxID=201089 RepID=E1YCZ0_9BACT|nr:RNA polymerase sigma-54 factor [uncultured Desulfobacterium sp.]